MSSATIKLFFTSAICSKDFPLPPTSLNWRFGFGPQEAEFLLGLTIDEKKVFFIQENCEAEIAKWEALKRVLAVQ